MSDRKLYVVVGDIDYETRDSLIAVRDHVAGAIGIAKTEWRSARGWDEIRVVPLKLGTVDWKTVKAIRVWKHPASPPSGPWQGPRPPRKPGEAMFIDDGEIPSENGGPTWMRDGDEVRRVSDTD